MLNSTELIQIDDMKMFESDDLETLLHKILNYLRHIIKADAGTIYLKEEDSLRFHIFQNDSFSYETIFKLQKPLKDLKFKLEKNSHTIAVESFMANKIITVDDIYNDTEFDFKSSKEFDKKFNYKTKSILTAPLVNFYSGNIIGVIQLINKKSKQKFIPFTKADKQFISLSGYLIALSITTTQHSIEELRRVSIGIEEKIVNRTKDLESVQQKLIEQVNKDSMTGLYNRRYLNEIGKDLFTIAKNTQGNLSIIILDIDDFKIINDTYGHSVGDEVINNISLILQNSVRKNDFCVRFGGEEFVIVLPNATLLNGIKIAENVRKQTEINELKISKLNPLKYTISLGVAEILNEDESLEAVLKRADENLYKAKRSGKNIVKY